MDSTGLHQRNLNFRKASAELNGTIVHLYTTFTCSRDGFKADFFKAKVSDSPDQG